MRELALPEAVPHTASASNSTMRFAVPPTWLRSQVIVGSGGRPQCRLFDYLRWEGLGYLYLLVVVVHRTRPTLTDEPVV